MYKKFKISTNINVNKDLKYNLQLAKIKNNRNLCGQAIIFKT